MLDSLPLLFDQAHEVQLDRLTRLLGGGKVEETEKHPEQGAS